MQSLPVFYHASTIVTVDDDELFTKALIKMVPSELGLSHFTTPEKCLEFFQGYVPPLAQPFLKGCDDHEHYETIDHAVVNFDVPKLHVLKDQQHRLQEVSVMIVDYNMPGMNGIELCRLLKKIPAKKILLTGDADDKEAIEAFNDNIIDRFIRKDSVTLSCEIKKFIQNLTMQYYREQTKLLLGHLEVECQSPLSDPEFVKFFEELCLDRQIREYYLIDKNGSYLLIDENNQKSILIVHTDRTLDAFIELNDDVIEAEEFINLVKHRRKVPFFGIGKESWQFLPESWDGYFYDAGVLVGREKYYWATV